MWTRALSRQGLLIFFLVSAGWLIPAFSAARADDIYVPAYHPELRISRALGEIKIDGDLGDAGWRGAAKAGNFAEHEPGDQQHLLPVPLEPPPAVNGDSPPSDVIADDRIVSAADVVIAKDLADKSRNAGNCARS